MKENNSKLNAFFNRPFLSAVIMVIVLLIVQLLIRNGLSALFETFMPGVWATIIAFVITTIIFLVFWIIYLKKRKDDLPIRKKQGFGKVLVLCIPAIVYFIYLIIVRRDAIQFEAVHFIYALVIALQAGIVEEIVGRGVPMGNAMRTLRTKKSVIWLVIVTAFLFGFEHMYHVFIGGAFSSVLAQSINAFAVGLFFAALYLRTGSVVPGMILHIINDILSGYNPAGDLASGAAAASANLSVGGFGVVLSVLPLTIFWIIITIFMLRKSKWKSIWENFGIAEN